MTIINRTITIPMNSITDINDYILRYFDENVVGQVDKDNGYISSIKKIVKVKKDVISRISNKIIFNVWVEVESMCPEVGQIYKEKILAISDNNILCKKDNVFLFVFIDSLNSSGYTYDSINNKFVKIYKKIVDNKSQGQKQYKKVKRTLDVNKEIKLRIKDFNLDKDENSEKTDYKYICICDIVED